jgi:hypothetical protein
LFAKAFAIKIFANIVFSFSLILLLYNNYYNSFFVVVVIVVVIIFELSKSEREREKIYYINKFIK